MNWHYKAEDSLNLSISRGKNDLLFHKGVQYSGMQKSKRPITEQCRNPNDRSFEQTSLDFGPFGSFDCSDFGAYSINVPKMSEIRMIEPHRSDFGHK